jgi:hypothetical protein
MVKFLFLLCVILFSSCAGLSKEDRAAYLGKHDSLLLGGNLKKDVDVLFYRNVEYSGRSDLTSWYNSQKILEFMCVDYWGISASRVKVIQGDSGVRLLEYLKNYKGSSLIISFSSHLESDGQLILHGGNRMPLSVLAKVLNELSVETLLLFDTCYAGLLKPHIDNPLVSVVYTGLSDEQVLDLRVRGQRPSLSSMCSYSAGYAFAVWSRKEMEYSPFGIFLLKAYLEGSKRPLQLGELLEKTFKYNEDMREIFGMGKYSSMGWLGSTYWKSFEVK